MNSHDSPLHTEQDQTLGHEDPISNGDAIQQSPRSHSSEPAIPFLYSFLTLEEAAAWLRIGARQLSLKSKGKRARIPAIWLNQRVVRYSPLLILAKAGLDAGLPIKDVMAAILSQSPAQTDWSQLLNELKDLAET